VRDSGIPALIPEVATFILPESHAIIIIIIVIVVLKPPAANCGAVQLWE
jgi:hypothetical protein